MSRPLLQRALGNPDQPMPLANVARHLIVSESRLPKTRLVLAIQNHAVPIETVRKYAQELEVELRNAEGAVQGRHLIKESPLTVAAQAGRQDAIELLLRDYSELLSSLKFVDSDPEFADKPPLHRHCLTATRAAIQRFLVLDDEAEKQKTQNCAVSLALRGIYWGPLTPVLGINGRPVPGRFVLAEILDSAINAGMDGFVMAVISRTLDQSPEDRNRQILIDQGLREILLRTARSGRFPEVIKHIANTSYVTDGEVLPLPLDPRGSFGSNPIAAALNSIGGQRDALQIFSMLKDPLYRDAERNGVHPEEYAFWLLNHGSIKSAAATGECYDYFLEHMEYLKILTSRHREVDSEFYDTVMGHREDIVNLVLLHGKRSIENFRWAAVNGFDTSNWLRRAILWGNTGAVQEIIRRWATRRQSLEVLLPPVKPILGFHGCNFDQTALSDAVRVGHIAAVALLIGAGADPKSVSSEQWVNFANEIQFKYYNLSRADFKRQHFRYGFVNRDPETLTDKVVNRADDSEVDKYVELVISLAREHSGYPTTPVPIGGYVRS
ncbi:hypothetical protein F5Y11DRAFT_336078 [Daldinia sp. FL1419]|nr:hypothetical protein F5Y11DRAFT_336078 [Daldinia sp. FL1419]